MTSLADGPGRTSSPVARRFLDCLSAQDFDGLAASFTVDVTLRALLPGEMKEWQGAERVTNTFMRWLGDTNEYELVGTGIDEIRPRLRVWWRARLRAERLGDGWFVVEQQAYVDTTEDDRIRHLSLVCSGYLAEISDQ